MANRPSSSLWFSPVSSLIFPRGSDPLWYLIALLSIFSLFLHQLSRSSLVFADSHFEGFDVDDENSDEILDNGSLELIHFRSTPLTQSEPETHDGPSDPIPTPQPFDVSQKPSSSGFDYWDEDEFEGIPIEQAPETPKYSQSTENATTVEEDPNASVGKSKSKEDAGVLRLRSYSVEIVCVSVLIMFIINYFTGKRANENIALAWAARFATSGSIFEKNFSLLGVGDGDDSPLLLKEGQNVFKFYASGRRYCEGLLATMELKSRHDLITRIYNLIVPCKDEINFEVYMNEDAMDHLVFALAKKKAAKGMHKEVRDLQRYATLVSPPSNRKWVAEELAVISESKEVAGDMITDTVLDQVFGEKAFEKFGKGFISMHFSDQQLGMHKKVLFFKFALPDANQMADMARLVALVPYYIDLIGRYKLSSQVRSKTEGARVKAAQEAYKEVQNARQEALQKKKAERRKIMEETEAKLSAEALRKREAKERARQMKKAAPKVKMTRAH